MLDLLYAFYIFTHDGFHAKNLFRLMMTMTGIVLNAIIPVRCLNAQIVGEFSILPVFDRLSWLTLSVLFVR
jgi:hypothetical protein